MKILYLIVGLGNPGPRHLFSRHNVGFCLLDYLSRRKKIPTIKFVDCAVCGCGVIGGKDVILARPLTYMNRSGLSVSRLVERYGIEGSRLLVVYDDMDLELGRLRLRPAGGSGGHRGLDSVVNCLGMTEFNRLRIGIGRPPRGMDPADYVLSKFSKAEEKFLQEEVLPKAAEAVEVYLADGIETAMNKFNNIKY